MRDDAKGNLPQDPARHARHPIDGPGADDAPGVGEFFTRERAAAPDLGADSERWQRIVDESTSHRPSWRGYAAGAAAAVVLATAGWAVLGRQGTAVPAGTATSSSVVASPSRTSGAATSSVPTTAAAPPVVRPSLPTSAAPPQRLPAVPASFAVHSLTTSADRRLFALGSIACSGGTCAALARSTDNGASWGLVHVFAASTTPVGTTIGRPAGAGTITQVRFASPLVGWAFGGAALRTVDGGATWQDYPHPGGDVIDLETNGTDVVLTTAHGCTGGVCQGLISVVRAPVASASATDVAGTVDGGTVVLDAQVAWQGAHAFVSPIVAPRAGTPPPSPVIVAPDGLHRAGPTSCGTGQAIRLVTPAAGTTLFALCPSGGAAGHIGYLTRASTDEGTSWAPAGGSPLLLVNAGQTAFAATDSHHLLAVSGGTPDLHGSMSLSADGGASWRDPRSAPPLPDRGWGWVGAPGGSTFYAIAGQSTGTYWKSTDAGDTWTKVPVAGR